MAKINCLGVLVVDALSATLTHYPLPGKVPQMVTESLRLMPGGGAANTASALGRMGMRVALFSKLGHDLFGEFVLRELAAANVDTAGVVVSDGDTTPFTYVAIHPGGERTFIHTPGANLTLTLDEFDREALLDADFLLYQDLWVLPGADGKPAAKLLAEARHRGVTTLLDECWGLGPNRETWEAVLPGVDYALPSLQEMAAIYPGRSKQQIADSAHRRGVHGVVLKAGAQGCFVSDGASMVRIPSCAGEVVDTTGAGDCFNAGFVAGLTRGLPLVDAARMGTLASAACISRVGGSAGIPPLAELLARLPETRIEEC